MRGKGDGISGSLILWKTWWNWYLTPVVNFGEFRRIQLAKSTHSLPRRGPWNLFRSFKVCSDAKERVTWKSKWKLPHLFISSKTATLVPAFAVEDQPIGRTATLVPALAMKDLPLGRTPRWWWFDMRSSKIRLRKLKLRLGDIALLTARPSVLPYGSKHFSRIWFFGTLTPRI